MGHYHHLASVLEESLCDRILICDKFKGRNHKLVLFIFRYIMIGPGRVR